MKRPKAKCFLCDQELENKTLLQTCIYCKCSEETDLPCPDGHFICSVCREKELWDLVDDYCISSTSANPVEMAEMLMLSPNFKMHCPDHHYLVPAVLLASYGKVVKKRKKLPDWQKIARNRAKKVPGAFCGTHGSCGAAVGTGIFMSTIAGATPLSEMEWELCNSIVGNSLLSMAKYGGPRCCKRVTYLALQESVRFLKERLSVKLDIPEKIECRFSHRNEEQCLKEKCDFYPAPN
nr:DUF5714 domain-containing protein [uncultured Draconibacterium sp.]